MKFWADPSVVPDDLPVVPFVLPFGEPARRTRQGDDESWSRRFDDWMANASTWVSRTSLSESDVAVVPLDWYWVRGPSWASRPRKDLADRCAAMVDRAQAADRRSVVFFTGDRSCDRVALDGALVCREGAFASHLGPNDLPMPAFVEDLVEHYFDGVLELRELGDRPVIGFCGLAGARNRPADRLREVLFRLRTFASERWIHPSQFTGENLRADAIERLRADDRCVTNFVIRESSVFFTDRPASELIDVRRQYVDNLHSSDYSLCIRGSGNYSYRLYETLCAGRIPIIVDTDLALPASDVIDWQRVGVWVRHDQVDEIGSIVAEFHQSLTPDRFADLQRSARDTWERHLRPAAWFSALPGRVDRWAATASR